MKKFFLYVLFFGFTLIQLKSQTVDFYRIGNQIIPILGESYLQSSNHTTLGILIQESQWLDVKSRQTLDLLVFFKDKEQYLSFLYASPYWKNQEFEFAYFKKLNSFFMLGIEIGNRRQIFTEDLPLNTLLIGINAIINLKTNHQLIIKVEKGITYRKNKINNGFIIGINHKINESLALKIYYAYNMDPMVRGLRGTINGGFQQFEGEIGWEPLPYSLSGGLAYNLPKSCKFGLSLRNHQWLGLLTSVYFQKQLNQKSK